jgi:hypothetical protein
MKILQDSIVRDRYDVVVEGEFSPRFDASETADWEFDQPSFRRNPAS